MALLTLRIEDTRTGQVEERILGDWYQCLGDEGVLIGSAEDCTVRLVAEGVAAYHARYVALGHHRFLDIIAGDTKVPHSPRGGARARHHQRVDYSPFNIGPYILCFGEAVERTPRAEGG